MGNQHDSLALLLMELMENIHDFPSGNGIESAGGLVCQDDGRVVGHGPGDGHALLLTFLFAHACVHHGQLHVAEGRGTADQVVGLEYKTNLPVTDTGQFFVFGARNIHTVQGVGPAGGAVQHADDIHQRSFAGTRCAYDGHKLALFHL